MVIALCGFVIFRQHYEHKLKEMDVEVQRHEQEHERLLADLEKLEKQTEAAVQASKLFVFFPARPFHFFSFVVITPRRFHV